MTDLPKRDPLLPYKLAVEIDQSFSNGCGGAFTNNQYLKIVEAIIEIGSDKNKIAAANFFKTLTVDEIIFRSEQIIRLTTLLNTIRNNAISC